MCMWFVAFSTCKNDASSGLMRSIAPPVGRSEGTATVYPLPLRGERTGRPSVLEQGAQVAGDVVDLREHRVLERRLVGDRRVERGEAPDGRVEILEALVRDPRRDLGAE